MVSKSNWVTVFAAVFGVDAACHETPTPPTADDARQDVVAVTARPTPPADLPDASAAPVTNADASARAPGPLEAVDAAAPVRPEHQPSAICGVSYPADRHGSADPDPGVVGDAQISAIAGGMPNDERVLASLRPAFRRCLNKSLAQDPTLDGTMQLAIAVAADGEVSRVNVTAHRGLPQSLVDCVVAMAQRAHFDANGAHVVTVDLKMQKQ